MVVLRLFVILLLLQGCSSGAPTGGNFNTEKGLSLIDQGQYDQAIAILSDQLAATPNDPRTRILLASAYAARSGLILVNFSGFARTLLARSTGKIPVPPPAAVAAGMMPMPPATPGAPRAPGAPGIPGVPVTSAKPVKMVEAKMDLTPVQKLNWEVDLVFVSLNAVPNVMGPMQNIFAAIEVLNAPHLTPGGYLYRALLKLVVFKARFYREYRLEPTADCKIKPQALDKWLERVEIDLQDIFTDVQTSLLNPAKKAKIQSIQDRISEVNKDVRESLQPEMSKALINVPFILKKQYAECRR